MFEQVKKKLVEINSQFKELVPLATEILNQAELLRVVGRAWEYIEAEHKNALLTAKLNAIREGLGDEPRTQDVVKVHRDLLENSAYRASLLSDKLPEILNSGISCSMTIAELVKGLK